MPPTPVLKADILNNLSKLLKEDPGAVTDVQAAVSNCNPQLSIQTDQPDLTTALNNLSFGQKLKIFEKGDNFVTFCGRFLEHIQLIKMPIAQQLPFFLQSISDDILYDRLKAVELTPEQSLNSLEFIREFKEAIYGDDVFFLKNKLLDCNQSPNESIKEYSDRLRKKAAIACPQNPIQADEMCLMAFIRGVQDPQIKLHLNKECHKKFSAAIKSAKNVERALKICEPQNTVINTPTPILKNQEVNFDTSNQETGEPHSKGNSQYRSTTPYNRHRSTSRESHRGRSPYRRGYSPHRSSRRHSPSPHRSRSNSQFQYYHDYPSAYRYRSQSREKHHSRNQSPHYRSRNQVRYSSRAHSNSSRTSSRSNSRGRYQNNNYNQKYHHNNQHRGNNNFSCYNCGDPNHFQRNCPKPRQQRSHQNF
jgi:hypothetical protein